MKIETWLNYVNLTAVELKSKLRKRKRHFIATERLL